MYRNTKITGRLGTELRELIVRAATKHNGDVRAMATALGCSASLVYRRMAQLGLHPVNFRKQKGKHYERRSNA